MSFESFSDQFIDDASLFGPSALEEHISQLDLLIKDGKGPSSKEAEILLDQLRGERCFQAILSVTALLGGNLSPMSRIYQAQALIEQNDNNSLRIAKTKLEAFHPIQVKGIRQVMTNNRTFPSASGIDIGMVQEYLDNAHAVMQNGNCER